MALKPNENAAESGPLSRSPELMNREDTALLVVDAQEKFLAVVPDSARIVWNIRRLIDAARVLGMPIAAMEQYPEKLGPLAPELKQRLGQVSSKLAFSACQCGDVFKRWSDDGISRVLVCGIETHVCIMQTALDLAANGFEPYVAVDASGTRHVNRSRNRVAAHGVGRGRVDDDRSGDV